MPTGKLKRTTFTWPDYFVLLRRLWVTATEQDRRHFLYSRHPALPEEHIQALITLEADEPRLRGVVVDDGTPLDMVHRYWRQVPADERLHFLVEMLTPNERRALQFGFEDAEGEQEP